MPSAVSRATSERSATWSKDVTQIAAVRSALNRVAVELVEKELLRCLSAWSTKDAVEAERRFNEAMKALSLMIKQS